MYAKLDNAIYEAIRLHQTPWRVLTVNLASGQIATETGRDQMRVIDGRIQALRKKGLITYTKRRWHVVNDMEAA